MNKLITVSIAVLSGLTWLGCGSSGTKVVTVTSTATGSTSHSGGSPLTTISNGTSTTTTTSSGSSGQGSGQGPAVNVVHVATFKSPTGNIGCMIVAGTARCDVRQRSWTPGARPHNCPQIVDYGQGLIVTGSGVGHLVCAGDTVLDPSAKTLPYGTDTVIGSFRCQSRSTGVVCANTGDGHGFFISLEAYRVF